MEWRNIEYLHGRVRIMNVTLVRSNFVKHYKVILTNNIQLLLSRTRTASEGYLYYLPWKIASNRTQGTSNSPLKFVFGLVILLITHFIGCSRKTLLSTADSRLLPCESLPQNKAAAAVVSS